MTTTDITPENLARMLEGVTPGPWKAHGSHIYGLDPARSLVGQVLSWPTCGEHDISFIAWAREAVPALAARLAEVEADRDKWAGEAYDTAMQLKAADAKVARLTAALQEIAETENHTRTEWRMKSTARAALEETKE
jgi:hypothetical protein